MRKKWVGILTCVGLAIALPAQASTWSCAYNGNWSTYNSSDKGTFNWKMIWASKAGKDWKVTGNYTDRYGKSILDGTCDDKSCSLTQVYQSGELKGKQYYWVGTYTDESKGGSTTINRFEGTWGSKPNAGEGPWQAIATCARN